MSPGESFLKPSWDLEQDFLQFYYTLGIQISTLKLPDTNFNGEILATKRRRVYEYLEMLDTKEALADAYKAVVLNFICQGVRVADLEADILLNIQCFGVKDAFFHEDIEIIEDFCIGILAIHNNFNARYDGLEIKQKCFSRPDYFERFDELVSLCNKIYSKINPQMYKRYQAELAAKH